MLREAKALARKVLPTPVFSALKNIQRRVAFARPRGFSEEEHTILRYLDTLPLTNRYCVDIAAQDGVGGSQTAALFKRGWSGLAVEADPKTFAILADLYSGLDGLSLVRTKVVPDNVVSVLRAGRCPTDFSFLSLDIDSYDFFLLEQILTAYRPSLACIEINENIPPPVRFTVTYHPDQAWTGDHFQGQSIAQCYDLCRRHDYDIVELLYNNLLIVPREINPHPALLPQQAYNAGYRNRPDRRVKFPWNADMEDVLTMSAPDAIEFLNKKFAPYAGRYLLESSSSADRVPTE